MMRVAAIAIALLLGTSVAAPRAQGSSPLELYKTLLAKSYPDSQLPRGFSSAKISPRPLSGADENAGVVGLLTVTVKGPDRTDFIAYLVYATAADARADLGLAPNYCCGAHLHVVPGGIPGSSLPSHVLLGTAPLKTGGAMRTFAIALAGIERENVDIWATTARVTRADRNEGNVHAAIALAHSALAHLATAYTGNR